MGQEAGHRCRVLTIAVARYKDESRNRPPLEEAGKDFADLYEAAGGVGHRRLLGHVDKYPVEVMLGQWGSDGADIGLLLWTGHIERATATDKPRLLTSDAYLAVAAVADSIAEKRFWRWLIIIDGCYAWSAGSELLAQLDTAVKRAPEAACVILSSADDIEPADAGVFTKALAEVLGKGWSRREQCLEFDEVVRRLDKRLLGTAVRGTKMQISGRRPGRCFPNPRYAPSLGAGALDEAHFLPKARGIDAGETGWFFTGRANALTLLVQFLNGGAGGMCVVSGSAGTGKSALLGRLITLSVPKYRRIAAEAGVLVDAKPGTVPKPKAITVAFYARDKRVDELLAFLADALHVTGVREVTQLLESRRVRERGFTLAVDALDEAAGGHARLMLDEVLVPLARTPRVKVVVGTRPRVADWGAEFGVTGRRLVDLDFEPDTAADLAAYAEKRLLRLTGSHYQGKPGRAKQVAAAVARRAVADASPDGRQVGSFLFARVLTKTLAAQEPIGFNPGWEDRLPGSFAEALEDDLRAYGSRLGTDAETSIRLLLEGLAWDEGSGVPLRLIPVMAEAVTGAPLGDAETAMLLREAGGHLVEADVDGWAVYRLYHERLREHLREVTRRREANVG